MHHRGPASLATHPARLDAGKAELRRAREAQKQFAHSYHAGNIESDDDEDLVEVSCEVSPHDPSEQDASWDPQRAAQLREEALRTAERLVYGWPSRDADPTGARSLGRFVKSFPLDFPMGIGDLYEERPRQVSAQVWVQHLLRYHTGHFVGGVRGQRVLWAMVNVLDLSQIRAGHAAGGAAARRGSAAAASAAPSIGKPPVHTAPGGTVQRCERSPCPSGGSRR